MQINNIGSGHNHNMHQVTGCMHEQDVSKKGAAAAGAKSDSGQRIVTSTGKQADNSFSLVAWLRDKLSGGKHLLQKIWGDKGENTIAQEMAASANVKPAVQDSNPYFSTIEDAAKEKKSIRERIKVRFQEIAGQLTGRFSGKNSFQTRQEKPKEDLRKHSTYKKDDLEIDCILTDDSYLLDSYDKKGEYSKLSTKK